MQRMFGSITQKRPLETSDIRGWAKVAKLARLMALPWDCELRVAWLESRRFFDNKQVHWLPKFQAGGRVEFASPPCQKLGFSLDLSGDGRPVRCPKLGASNYILKSYLKSAENSSKASETRINTGCFYYGGEGGIRTPVTLSSQTVFKTAGFNRSPTSPFLIGARGIPRGSVNRYHCGRMCVFR